MKKLLISAAIAITVASSAFADPRTSLPNSENIITKELPDSNLLNSFPNPNDLGFDKKYAYTLVPIEPQCTNTDILIGVGTGLVVGTTVGLIATVGTPIAMPVTATTAVLTGTKVTLTEAIKQPQVGMILASNAILAPITGSVAYTVSCAWDPISNYTSSKYGQFKDYTINRFNYYWGS